jgi:hypothetical protein
MSYRYLYLPTYSPTSLVGSPHLQEHDLAGANYVVSTTNQMTIPPELMTAVIQYLPRSDRRTLLSVSRYFHDVAVQFVFRTVHIYLGEWANLRALEWWNPPPNTTDNRSWELLYHILYDPHFANVVRKVVVHGPTDNKCGLDLTGCQSVPPSAPFFLALNISACEQLALSKD